MKREHENDIKINWNYYICRPFIGEKAISTIQSKIYRPQSRLNYATGVSEPILDNPSGIYRENIPFNILNTENNNIIHTTRNIVHISVITLPVLSTLLNNYNEDERHVITDYLKAERYTLEMPNVYLDHKVGSAFSTLADLWLNAPIFNPDMVFNEDDSNIVSTGLSLVNSCNPTDNMYYNIQDLDTIDDPSCPPAWYKHLNYDTGLVDYTYLPRIRPIDGGLLLKRRNRCNTKKAKKNRVRKSTKKNRKRNKKGGYTKVRKSKKNVFTLN